MRVRFGYVIAACALVAALGCHGGRQDIPVSEAVEDTIETFIFAESGLMDIDSEMMSKKLATIQVPGSAPRIDTAMAMKAAYLILADTFLTREAENVDLERESPTLYKQYLDLRQDRILRQMYLEIIAEQILITDSMVRASYDTERESYRVPDQYRARHIVISGEGLRYSDDSLQFKDMTADQLDSAAYAKLAEIRQRLVDGDNFDTLAMLYSQDENTRRLGGDLGYFQLVRMVHPFDSTVEHTPVGEISGVIKTQFGWHVLRVDDFEPEHNLQLDSVYSQVERKLLERMHSERTEAFIDSLRENAHITFDTATMNIPDSLHEPADIMAIINPDDTSHGCDTLFYSDYKRGADYYRRINNLKGELDFDHKKEILLNAATRPLLWQAARDLGYFEHPSVVEWSKNKLSQYSTSILRGQLLESTYEPTEEEMREYYESNIGDYRIERPVSVQHIVFEDSAIAEYVRDLLISGVDFMDMVDEYYPGDPDIKRAAADLGAIGPDDMPEPFYRAALRIPVGSISHPVKTRYGYHLIKVLSRDYSLSFEQASIKIRGLLKQRHEREQLRQFVESRLGAPLKINWEYLDRLQFPRGSAKNPSPSQPISGANE